MKNKNIIVIINIFLMIMIPINKTSYLGWIFRGNGVKPISFPKDEKDYSVEEIVCTSSSASWDYSNQKVVIKMDGNNNSCNVIVGDKIERTTSIIKDPRPQLDNKIASCKAIKETQEKSKSDIVNAIKNVEGTIDDLSETKYTYAYLGEIIKESLYVYPKIVTYTHKENLQEKTQTGNHTFELPFKSKPSCEEKVSCSGNCGEGKASCSGSYSSVSEVGYKWSLTNSSGWNATCSIKITCTQP